MKFKRVFSVLLLTLLISSSIVPLIEAKQQAESWSSPIEIKSTGKGLVFGYGKEKISIEVDVEYDQGKDRVSAKWNPAKSYEKKLSSSRTENVKDNGFEMDFYVIQGTPRTKFDLYATKDLTVTLKVEGKYAGGYKFTSNGLTLDLYDLYEYAKDFSFNPSTQTFTFSMKAGERIDPLINYDETAGVYRYDDVSDFTPGLWTTGDTYIELDDGNLYQNVYDYLLQTQGRYAATDAAQDYIETYFTLVNQQEENEPSLGDGETGDYEHCVYDDDETWWTALNGAQVTVSEDTTIKAKGTSSLNITRIPGAASHDIFQHDYGVGTELDISDYGFGGFYWTGAGTGNFGEIRLIDADGDFVVFSFQDNFIDTRRFVFGIYGETWSGDFDLDSIRYIKFRMSRSNDTLAQWNLDRFVFDSAIPCPVEFGTFDSDSLIQLYGYDGTDYHEYMRWGDELGGVNNGSTKGWINPGALYWNGSNPVAAGLLAKQSAFGNYTWTANSPTIEGIYDNYCINISAYTTGTPDRVLIQTGDNTVLQWTEVAGKLGAETYIFSLAVLDGEIYGGTIPNGKLYKWNGVDSWTEVAGKLGAEIQIRSLAVLDGEIYGGTSPNGKLYKWNGVDSWTEVAGTLGAETYIYSLVVLDGEIYGGTYPNGKLYNYERSVTTIQAYNTTQQVNMTRINMTGNMIFLYNPSETQPAKYLGILFEEKPHSMYLTADENQEITNFEFNTTGQFRVLEGTRDTSATVTAATGETISKLSEYTGYYPDHTYYDRNIYHSTGDSEGSTLVPATYNYSKQYGAAHMCAAKVPLPPYGNGTAELSKAPMKLKITAPTAGSLYTFHADLSGSESMKWVLTAFLDFQKNSYNTGPTAPAKNNTIVITDPRTNTIYNITYDIAPGLTAAQRMEIRSLTVNGTQYESAIIPQGIVTSGSKYLIVAEVGPPREPITLSIADGNLTTANYNPLEETLTFTTTTTGTTTTVWVDSGSLQDDPYSVSGTSNWKYYAANDTVKLLINGDKTVTITYERDFEELKDNLRGYLVMFYILPVIVASVGIKNAADGDTDENYLKTVGAATAATLILAMVLNYIFSAF